MPMRPERWFPDEAELAQPENHDPDFVAAYDGKTHVRHAAEVFLLQQLGLDEQSTLVDVGSGTGAFARAVAPHCGRVVAVEISAAMVAHARKATAESVLSNIEWVEAGFLSYEHTGEPADFLYSRNALHHLPDFWKAIALRRLADVLRPGGILRLIDMGFSFDPGEASTALESWLSTQPTDPAEGYTREEVEGHIRDEQITFTWLLEPMLEKAGFEITRASYPPEQTYVAYICTKR
jgi:ubiquinone/menaquinone biosynthesis C-methylase UbiE